MGLATRLDGRFYVGGVYNATVPQRLQVSIGGHAYLIDTKEYSRATVDSLRPFSDGGADVGENSLNPQALWRRSAIDWSLGFNQAYFDEPQTSDRRRFFSSKGVNPWNPRALSLLPDTVRKRADTTPQGLVSVQGYLYYYSGSTVYYSGDSGSTWMASSALPAAVTSLTTDGGYVYIAYGTGVQRTLVGSVSLSAFSSVATTVVGYANGRLLGSSGTSLFELTAAGAAIAVFTHPNINWAWDGIIGAPHGTYVWGHAGDHSEFYIIGVVDATGQLSSPIYAGDLPVGELVRAMFFYGGLLIIGSSRGIRLANVAGQGGLVTGPLTVIGDVRSVAAEGRYAWFSWSNYDATSTGLGRADLARFVFPMVPAIASDLMVTGQGAVASVALLRGSEPFLAVTGLGIYGPSTNLVPSGTIDSGIIRFGVVDPKLISFVDLRHDMLPAGASINTALTYDDGITHDVGSSQQVGSTGPPAQFGTGNPAIEASHLIVTLNRGTIPTQGPVLHRWLMKGIPTPTPIDTIKVPVLLYETITNNTPEGEEIQFNTRAEFDFLRNLVSTRSVVLYQEGTAQIPVYVEALEVHPTRWNWNRSFFEGLVMVQLKTLG